MFEGFKKYAKAFKEELDNPTYEPDYASELWDKILIAILVICFIAIVAVL